MQRGAVEQLLDPDNRLVYEKWSYSYEYGDSVCFRVTPAVHDDSEERAKFVEPRLGRFRQRLASLPAGTKWSMVVFPPWPDDDNYWRYALCTDRLQLDDPA